LADFAVSNAHLAKNVRGKACLYQGDSCWFVNDQELCASGTLILPLRIERKKDYGSYSRLCPDGGPGRRGARARPPRYDLVEDIAGLQFFLDLLFDGTLEHLERGMIILLLCKIQSY